MVTADAPLGISVHAGKEGAANELWKESLLHSLADNSTEAPGEVPVLHRGSCLGSPSTGSLLPLVLLVGRAEASACLHRIALSLQIKNKNRQTRSSGSYGATMDTRIA